MSVLVEHLNGGAAVAPLSAGDAGAERSAAGHDAVLEFVRTPFSVRRNVVRVWKPLPGDIWTALREPADYRLAARREAAAIGCVLLMSVIIVGAGPWLGMSVGIGEGTLTTYPLIGPGSLNPGEPPGVSPRSGELPSGEPRGWTLIPPVSAPAVLWTVVPPLLGWWTVRRIWIPASMARLGDPAAAMTFARHLSGVYLYVFLMITAGLAFSVILLHLAPAATQRWRWWLWLFLFGESFFVPAVAWTRLVLHDRRRRVFGPRRRAALAAYLAAFVVVPLAGMARFTFFP